MSALTTLYRRFDRDFRGNEPRFKHVPAGEFRKMSWCKSHADWTAEHFDPARGRCRWCIHVLAGDPATPCRIVERWIQVESGSSF